MKTEKFQHALERAAETLAQPFVSRFNPAEDFGEWMEACYIPAAGFRRASNGNHTRVMKPRRQEQMRYLVRLVNAFLHRRATMGDITPEMIERFKAWHTEAFPSKSGKWLVTDTNSVLRFCKTIPDGRVRAGRKRKPLSEEEGTLWHLCRTRYFARNMKIRSDKTKLCYRQALCDFRDALGHEPTLADLNEEALITLVVWAQDQKDLTGSPRMAAKTINERSGRIKALWHWCARKRLVDEFPDGPRIPEPWRTPVAWNEEQLARLFAAAAEEVGILVPGIWARDWWLSLHYVQYDCGERIGALLQARWEHLDFTSGNLNLPAEIRKAKRSDKINPLRAHTLEVLARMKHGGHELIWPCPWKDTVTFYQNYNRQLRRAKLPTDRKSKTHRMRRTCATHLAKAGVDASIALGHSDPRVTRDSYLDTTQLVERRYCDLLPTPAELAAKHIDGREPPPRLPAPAPLGLPYYPPAAPEPMADELAWL